MSYRYLGGVISPLYNPLAANIQPDGAVNSIVQTQGVFTRQTSVQSIGANEWCTDPYFNQTSLLIQADNKANNAINNTFIDDSANNATITKVGNASQASPSPYSQPDGYWGCDFDGVGDYLTTPNDTALNMDAGDFTIELFVLSTLSQTANSGLVAKGAASTGFSLDVTGTTVLVSIAATAAVLTSAAGAVPQNSWTHIAFVRSGSTIYLFVNGAQISSATNSTNLTTTDVLRIGANRTAGSTFCGRISNLRIVKGTALYTSDFTPSNEPLEVVSGTSLLTCQSNSFKDWSANNFNFTVNGNTSIALQSPFIPKYTYIPEQSGGSLYCFQAGDYVSLPSSSTLTPGSVFTFEAWVRMPAIVSGMSIYGPTVAGELQVAFSGTTLWGIAPRGFGFVLTSSTLPKINQWNHIVVARGGTGTNETSLFLNGERVANGTVSDPFAVASGYQIGTNGAGVNAWLAGFISNLRLVVGTDVYGYTNTTITVPTEPVTAISGTQLLTNFANSAVYDASSNNTLRLVASAEVDTAVVKYGTGSIAFDGSGDTVYVYNNNNSNRFRTGDFTVEGWVYLSALGVVRGFVSNGSTSTGWTIGVTASNLLTATITTSVITGTTELFKNTWYHFALVRAGTLGGNIKIYLNGVLQATLGGATNTDFNETAAGTPLYIGADRSAAANVLGYMDDIRLTNGVARYTANFTPPQVGFQRQ